MPTYKGGDMSKERALLSQIAYELGAYIEGGYFPNAHVLLDKVENALVQPEQKPAAWTDDEYSGLMTYECREMHKSYRSRAWRNYPIPLYTSPPTCLLEECLYLITAFENGCDYDLYYNETGNAIASLKQTLNIGE